MSTKIHCRGDGGLYFFINRQSGKAIAITLGRAMKPCAEPRRR